MILPLLAAWIFPRRLKLKKTEIYETTKENGVRSFEIFGLWAVVCSSSVGIVDVVGKTHMGARERRCYYESRNYRCDLLRPEARSFGQSGIGDKCLRLRDARSANAHGFELHDFEWQLHNVECALLASFKLVGEGNGLRFWYRN